jgi:dienelactone hydrolase
MGMIVLLVALGIEVGFAFYCLKTEAYQNFSKHTIRLTAFALFCLLVLFNVVEWSFRWQLLFSVLLIQVVIGIVYLVREPISNKPFQKKRIVFACIRRCLLLTMVIIPAILFPQYEEVAVTGQYPVKTQSYTLTDVNRLESYTDLKENRQVTMQFWYPESTNNETYPLVIFSHGAFGFRGSNYSTFMELASHGYVVCSIDHTYQAFYTKQTDGKVRIVNNAFLNDAIAVSSDAYEDQKTYDLTHDWLKLRTEDMNLVLKTILDNAKKEKVDEVYQRIDSDKIGLFGHSLGGATAAVLGRERKDIDAVIVIDGTMIGEEVSFVNGKAVLNNDAYPVPLLNLYNEQHYRDALADAEIYPNTVASAKAVDAHQVVFKGAGHLNFTDLPLFSPVLAQKLGTGNIDSRYCIETMNGVVLNYFNHYLKDSERLNILKEY